MAGIHEDPNFAFDLHALPTAAHVETRVFRLSGDIKRKTGSQGYKEMTFRRSPLI